MNILIVHNAYQQHGGEDVIAAAEAAMLRGAGHRVHLEIVSNDSIRGVAAKAAAFWNTPYDARRRPWIEALLRQTGAEVVHVHNFFPLLTPAIHAAAAGLGVAVVQTLHNYRTICAAATLMREGVPCESCLSGSRYWGVVHRCYRNSMAGSLAVVRMQQRAKRTGVWHQDAHRLIALTEFGRRKFVEGGLPADRIVVKPNFVSATAAEPDDRPRSGALFVGRLAREKGVDVLLAAATRLSDHAVTIAGDGPERARLAAERPSEAILIGRASADEVRGMMARASCLVVPSLWYEGLPTVVLEAFAAGLPVVASRIGALTEIVEDGVTGVLFNPGDPQDLGDKLQALLDDPARSAQMGQRARAVFDLRYTETANLPLLEAIYRDAIELARVKSAC